MNYIKSSIGAMRGVTLVGVDGLSKGSDEAEIAIARLVML